ncbi:MAG: hypothetical protein U9N34_04720 [Candidatus Cloacimonadota bacterium]|nr:hypothetical protein [Candidatus Cloacimonadota bacterium]
MAISVSDIKTEIEKKKIDKSDKSLLLNALKKKISEIEEINNTQIKKAKVTFEAAEKRYKESLKEAKSSSVEGVLCKTMDFLNIEEMEAEPEVEK